MGTWGINLYDDDTTLDVRDAYIEKIKNRKTNEDTMKEMLEEFTDILESEEKQLFWFALADTQWNLGRLNEYSKQEAIKYIDNEIDLIKWKQDTNLYKKRKQILKDLKLKLLSKQPEEKKISKPRIYKCEWKIGDVFAYQLKSKMAFENNLNGKYLIIQKIDETVYYPKNIFPVVRVKITEDTNIPKNKTEIDKLEYIEIDGWLYNSRFSGIDARKPIQEQISNMKFEINEYGFLPVYQMCLMTKSKKNLGKDLIYLGNYQNILSPENEFKPINNVKTVNWKDFEQTIIESYLGNNKRQYLKYNKKNEKVNIVENRLTKQIENAVKKNIVVEVKTNQYVENGYIEECIKGKIWMLCIDEGGYYKSQIAINLNDIISIKKC